MSMSDPLADMLTRIRNASRANHPYCEMPASRLKRAVAEVLRDEGFIDSFEERGDGVHQVLRIQLRYLPAQRGRAPVLTGLKRVSKPGLRVYARADRVPRVYGGMGTSILSTSRGVMSGEQARRLGVGGEVLAQVW